MTVFEKMGHPAKKREMPFLVSVDSFFYARNYDILIIFLAYSVIMLRAVVFRYLVYADNENGRLEKFTSYPFTESCEEKA